jgi:phage shock protein C
MVCAACGSPMNGEAKFCSNCGRAVEAPAYQAEQRRLVRPREGRKIAGVCAGVALYTGWDLTLVRLVAALAAVFGVGMPVLAYLIGWIVMPEAPLVLPVQAYPQGQQNSQGPGATNA